MDKTRLDQYLVQNGYAPSREKAQAIIMSGIVYINNQKSEKSGTFLTDKDVVEVRGKALKYVSRGGLKLEKAIEIFSINLDKKIAMDIGASTGGFTDCMLQNGAEKVYCVDVGYGQLAWQIRENPKVINMERTNIRYIDKSSIKALGFISIDVSFISLKLVLPIAFDLLDENGECVALIKPQFEAGKDRVGKKGIVRDKDVHIAVIENVINFANSSGFTVCGLTHSPICGAGGNIEYLIHLQKNIESDIIESATVEIEEAVTNAHHCHYS
ncbi:TlyA family rRNA (cytidine-2'-O)-methyltransferase [Clostridia bacterium]|nr:TlyA family rRNA (cytidine-2'-O)-methyltransferase [Clostridia bacterium]